MDADRSAIVSARPAIEVDGQARPRLEAGLIRLAVRDGVDGLTSCEAEFGNWGVGEQEQLGYLWFGRDVIEFGKTLRIKLGDQVLFDGRIMAIEAAFPPTSAPTLVVRADDRLQDLRMTRRTRHFEGISDADLVSQIANDHGLQSDVNLNGPTWPLLVQANESDLAFLRRRMLVADADLSLRDGKVRVRSRSQRTEPDLTLTRGNQLRDIKLTADLAHQRTAITCSAWDVSGKQAAGETAEAACLGNEARDGDSGPQVLQQALGARQDTVAHRLPGDSAGARSEAESHFRLIARRFVMGTGEADANPRLCPGARVDLQGLGPLFSGAYGVNDVIHRFDLQRGLRTEFTVERAWIGRP